jgi:hypothetical protein
VLDVPPATDPVGVTGAAAPGGCEPTAAPEDGTEPGALAVDGTTIGLVSMKGCVADP